MDLFTRDDLRALLDNHHRPCVSFLMRTARGGQNQDCIRWKDQLREAERLLQASDRRANARHLLQPALDLLDQPQFWLNVSDGLAAFLAPEMFRAYRVPLHLADQVVVSDHFYLKPLVPLLSGEGRFHVLVLSRTGLRLLRCTPETVHEIDLSKAPAHTGRAFERGDESGYAGPSGGELPRPEKEPPTFDPSGLAVYTTRHQMKEYFHQVDRSLQDLLRDEPSPLVLAGAPEFLEVYRQANSFKNLLPEAVECEPDQLSNEQLRDRAGELVQCHLRESRAKLTALYQQLHGTGRTANELREVLPAAHGGQIQYLFADRRKEQWGRFDPATGRIDVHDRKEPGDDDLVNLAVVYTLAHGGTVHSVEPGEMPEQAPLVVIYRLPIGERTDTHAIAGSERA